MAKDPRSFARIFAANFRQSFADLAGEHAIPPEVALTEEEIVVVVRQIGCEHGELRVVDCLECGMRLVLAAQLNKLLKHLTDGQEMSEEDAEQMAIDLIGKYGLDG